jgi:hypothetical protein
LSLYCFGVKAFTASAQIPVATCTVVLEFSRHLQGVYILRHLDHKGVIGAMSHFYAPDFCVFFGQNQVNTTRVSQRCMLRFVCHFVCVLLRQSPHDWLKNGKYSLFAQLMICLKEIVKYLVKHWCLKREEGGKANQFEREKRIHELSNLDFFAFKFLLSKAQGGW